MGSQDGSPLRETRKDPFSAAAAECSCRQDGLTVIVTACLTFATGVTVALVMQIYFGDPQVRAADGQKGTGEKGVRKSLGGRWELNGGGGSLLGNGKGRDGRREEGSQRTWL